MRGLLAGAFSFGVAAIFFAVAYRVVFVLRIGPTAVTLSESNGWGAHTGDALALPLVAVGALFIAVGVSCFDHARRRPLPALVPRAPVRPSAGG